MSSVAPSPAELRGTGRMVDLQDGCCSLACLGVPAGQFGLGWLINTPCYNAGRRCYECVSVRAKTDG